MDPISAPDPMLDATLRQMADIALPPAVSMMPATWGWAALIAAVALGLAAVLWHWLRRRARNRYRREALAELSHLEKSHRHAGRAQARLAKPADASQAHRARGLAKGNGRLSQRRRLVRFPARTCRHGKDRR